MKWFCSFKAYGDLVIACHALRHCDPSEYGLLAGSHLRALIKEIGFSGQVKYIEVGRQVPALFDTRKRGYIQAIRSGFSLRSQLHRCVKSSEDTLVFDTLKSRQRLLAWPVHSEEIRQGAENIYLDYARYLGFLAESQGCSVDFGRNLKNIYIFPDSRINSKELPGFLLDRLVQLNMDYGIETTVIKVGQPIGIPGGAVFNVRWVDGFDQLIAQIRACDAIVSADSLPAHVAEYLGIPTFVFTPKANDYWMPMSAFKEGFFSRFDSVSQYKQWIKQA